MLLLVGVGEIYDHFEVLATVFLQVPDAPSLAERNLEADKRSPRDPLADLRDLPPAVRNLGTLGRHL